MILPMKVPAWAGAPGVLEDRTPGEHSRVPLESEAVIWGAQMSLRSLPLPPVHLGSWGLGRGAEEWEGCLGTVGTTFCPMGSLSSKGIRFCFGRPRPWGIWIQILGPPLGL